MGQAKDEGGLSAERARRASAADSGHSGLEQNLWLIGLRRIGVPLR